MWTVKLKVRRKGDMVEVCSVHTPSALRGFLSISEDEYVPGLKKLTDV